MTLWEKCVEFHGHSCGGLRIGYAAAEYAMQLLKISFSDNEQVVCISENDACGVDADRIPLPTPAQIFDSYNCECCGEKPGTNWIRIAGGRKLCLDCYESYDRFHV